MAENPAISVIVPVYNAEKWLHRCIDSILAQTFTDFELLLIDDGSTDRSGAICDEYATRDPRIRVFHKPNGGVSSARNLGLDNARGEWITFVDADDLPYENLLANYGIDNAQNADIICQGFETDKKYNFVAPNFYGSVKDYINIPNILNSFGYTWNKAYRRRIIVDNNLQFNKDIRFREDVEFLLRYLTHSKIVICNSTRGYFYIVPNSATKYPVILDESLRFYRSCFVSLNILEIDEDSDLRCQLRKGYEYALILLYNRLHSFKEKLGTIKEFQNLMKTDYHYSRIFPLTKFFIKYDSTYLFSMLLLDLQCRIKKNHKP